MPIPPKKSYKVSVNYKFRGRGEPLKYPLNLRRGWWRKRLKSTIQRYINEAKEKEIVWEWIKSLPKERRIALRDEINEWMTGEWSPKTIASYKKEIES